MSMLKIPDGVTYRRMWIGLTKFGYPIYGVMSDYKDDARKQLREAIEKWPRLEPTLVKAWVIWKPAPKAKE